jgi:ribosome biogenesis protein Tsr3
VERKNLQGEADRQWTESMKISVVEGSWEDEAKRNIQRAVREILVRENIMLERNGFSFPTAEHLQQGKK